VHGGALGAHPLPGLAVLALDASLLGPLALSSGEGLAALVGLSSLLVSGVLARLAVHTMLATIFSSVRLSCESRGSKRHRRHEHRTQESPHPSLHVASCNL